MNTVHPNRVFWKDPYYGVALLAGPIAWALLYIADPGSVTPSFNAVLLLKLALLYPVLEEIVFRGGVQTLLLERKSLQKRVFGLSKANLITSLLFAAAHLINQPPLWACLVFIPSLVFGWARERYGSLLPSMLLHSFYNAGFVLLLLQI